MKKVNQTVYKQPSCSVPVAHTGGLSAGQLASCSAYWRLVCRAIGENDNFQTFILLFLIIEGGSIRWHTG